MALMSWERHAQELMYCPDDAESASGWQCAGPEWQETAPDWQESAPDFKLVAIYII